MPSFGLIAKPLHKATKGPDIEPIIWEKEHNQAFNKLKQALVEAPDLGIHDLNKPFSLYIAEKPWQGGGRRHVSHTNSAVLSLV